jgi:hypothetical protein
MSASLIPKNNKALGGVLTYKASFFAWVICFVAIKKVFAETSLARC